MTEWPEHLAGMNCFAKFNITNEDKKKTNQYRMRAKFTKDIKQEIEPPAPTKILGAIDECIMFCDANGDQDINVEDWSPGIGCVKNYPFLYTVLKKSSSFEGMLVRAKRNYAGFVKIKNFQ